MSDNDQERLSEAYSDLKEKYIKLHTEKTRLRLVNILYRNFFNFVMNKEITMEEMLSESHDDLITKYAQRGAQYRALKDKI